MTRFEVSALVLMTNFVTVCGMTFSGACFYRWFADRLNRRLYQQHRRKLDEQFDVWDRMSEYLVGLVPRDPAKSELGDIPHIAFERIHDLYTPFPKGERVALPVSKYVDALNSLSALVHALYRCRKPEQARVVEGFIPVIILAKNRRDNYDEYVKF